mmetsp:Transcript_17593/g.42938  ORF Transcript_17593/g.42938 Transcript_17593/m.42938 type:complete len:238 (-) Transcript_17593:31-744(-)
MIAASSYAVFICFDRYAEMFTLNCICMQTYTTQLIFLLASGRARDHNSSFIHFDKVASISSVSGGIHSPGFGTPQAEVNSMQRSSSTLYFAGFLTDVYPITTSSLYSTASSSQAFLSWSFISEESESPECEPPSLISWVKSANTFRPLRSTVATCSGTLQAFFIDFATHFPFSASLIFFHVRALRCIHVRIPFARCRHAEHCRSDSSFEKVVIAPRTGGAAAAAASHRVTSIAGEEG